MQDVLGQPVESITQADYERESIKVLSTAWICYVGEVRDVRWRSSNSFYDSASHSVDDRLLTTIVSQGTDSILTCYHEHFDRPHKKAQRKFEQMVKYVEHLGYQRRGNMLRNFHVSQFQPPANVAAILEIELARVRAISDK